MRRQKSGGIDLGSTEPAKVLTAEEADALAVEWLNVFGKDKQGVNTKAFMWHLFSAKRYPSVSGANADEAYSQHASPHYVVLSNDREFAFVSDSRFRAKNISDYYVFPENLAWTMAFTHEDGWLGPYFAKHPEYDILNRDNVESILSSEQKRAEIERAKKQGWIK
jgi:hypothetical protein